MNRRAGRPPEQAGRLCYPRRCAALISLAALSLLFWILTAASRAEEPGGLFVGEGNSVRVVEQKESIGLANRRVGFLFRKADGALLGVWEPGQRNLLAAAPATPLWALEILPPGEEKPRVLPVAAATKTIFSNHGDPQARTLEMRCDGAEATVTVRATLAAEDTAIRWRFAVQMRDPRARLWSVTFPQIPVAALDAEAEGNEMVVPYRRGQTRTFGRGGPRGDLDLPYPGPAAKFQFVAAYGKQAGRGIYFAAEDGAAFTKSFAIRNYPQADSVVLAVQHFPANRGAGVSKFEQPYDIVTRPFRGDWWDAARLYRDWWTQQTWARRGLLGEQRDLPAWLLQAPFCVRPSTTKPQRTLENNLTALQALGNGFGGQRFFGTWYGCFAPAREGGSLDESGYGHLLPAKPGLPEAVRALRERGIYLQAYIQSMIFDSSLPPDAAGETTAVEAAVTRDQTGKPVPYGGGPGHLLAMCRATDWWQSREVALAQRAVGEWGFSGVYLDSFGKGAPECFAPDHGHAIGGGDTVIAGQRRMAARVRAAVRAVNPEAIMSGEDPVEAFRDLLDVNLYSVNVMPRYVPIYRAVWGDYSLGHGRALAPGKSADGLIPEMATLFLEGTILGRIYCEAPVPFLFEPAHEQELRFLKSLAAYTAHGLPWLRMGELLHPLDLGADLPPFDFHESIENQLVHGPSVLHSVTRSHADGSVGIVLVNISNAAQTLAVPIDPKLRRAGAAAEATLWRMDETGKLAKLGTSAAAWRQPLTLSPHEIAFLVLR